VGQQRVRAWLAGRGAIYPIATLPDGARQFALALPWTPCVAVLLAFAGLAVGLALRAFSRATLS
jgi:hypothetical protein